VYLVGVGQITKIFAINDVCLVSHSDTSSWKYTVVDGFDEEIVDFGPIWSRTYSYDE